MFHEPPALEVCITRLATKTFARPYYKNFVSAMDLNGTEKVLDFGSGAGGPASFIAKELKKGGGRLTCVDISQKWMKCIKENLDGYRNIDYKLGHIASLDIPDSSYDVICIHFVIHDIPSGEREKIISILVKKLKPGGIVFVREPINSREDEEIADLFKKGGMEMMHAKNIAVPLQGNAIEVKLKK